MKKYLILLCLVPNLIFANTVSYKTQTGTEIEINKKLSIDYIKGYRVYLDNLKECYKHKFKYINPVHGGKGFLEIFGKNKKNKCIISINYNSIKQYKCYLPKKIISVIYSKRLESLKSFENIETFTDIEKKIFHHKNYCVSKSIQKKQKELSQEELSKMTEKQPNLMFLLNSMKKRVKKD
jgi:hypothetical protein